MRSDKLNLGAEKKAQTDLGGVYKECQGGRRNKKILDT